MYSALLVNNNKDDHDDVDNDNDDVGDDDDGATTTITNKKHNPNYKYNNNINNINNNNNNNDNNSNSNSNSSNITANNNISDNVPPYPPTIVLGLTAHLRDGLFRAARLCRPGRYAPINIPVFTKHAWPPAQKSKSRRPGGCQVGEKGATVLPASITSNTNG